ncbi:MAG: spore cortex biosynthesis protein YabQ [Candidatus Heteroscillospira sp.]|jgi:hypothetical protein
MEIYALTQLTQALSSVLFGAVLGVAYDLLRALRRSLGVKSAPADFIFCLCALCALFYLGMSLGDGQLRIFMALFCALGTGLYLGCVTPFVLPVLIGALALAALPLAPVKKAVKKFVFFFKKLFQYPRKWFRIKHNVGALPARENPRDTKFSGEECLYGTQNRYDGKTASAGGGGVRPAEPRDAHGQDIQRKGLAGRSRGRSTASAKPHKRS